MTTRAEHVAWCKQRALEYVERGELSQALASMTTDLSKEDVTAGHVGSEIGLMMLMAGQLSTREKMRDFINGFN